MDRDPLTRLGVTPAQIADFCRRWNIVRFELFGSVLRDDFDAESDIDVLVTYAPGYGASLDELLGAEDELSALTRRKVDLVKRKVIEGSPNWIRRRAILNNARTVYAAA